MTGSNLPELSSPRLLDRVALITGAGGGVGAATARRLASEGAKLVLTGRRAEPLERVADSLHTLGHEPIVVVGDVRDESASEMAAQAAISKYGRIDIVVANAAVQLFEQDRPVHELSIETWEETAAVNSRGVFLICRAAIPSMLANGGGQIVIVGSITGLSAVNDRHHAYAASKGSITALGRVMAAAYARQGIRCNVVAPGVLELPPGAWSADGAQNAEPRRKLYEGIPMGRAGRFDEIAAVIAFLASADSSYITGATLCVDGGLTIAPST